MSVFKKRHNPVLAQEPISTNEIKREHAYQLVLWLIAVVYVLLMVLCSGYRPLVLDEIYQLDFSMHHSFVEALTLDPYGCPLFTALAWVWYHLAPYGDTALRMLTIAFAAASLPLTAGCARALAGRKAGIVASLFMFISFSLATHGALNFRPYSLYVLAAAWVLYVYLHRWVRISKGETVPWSNIIVQGLAMATLGYTHYLGLVFCAILFAFDLILLVTFRLKGNVRVFAAYGIAIILYLPWIGVLVQTFMAKVAPAAAAAGDAAATEQLQDVGVRAVGKSGEDATIDSMMIFLCGSELGYRIFHLFAVLLIVNSAWKLVRGRFTLREGLLPLMVLAMIPLMLYPFYYLATQTEIITTFWTERYFMPLMPCIAVVMAVVCGRVLAAAPQSNVLQAAVIAALLVFVGFYNGQHFLERLDNGDAAMYEPFANYLLAQDDIQDDSTCWLTYAASRSRQREIPTWLEYVFCQDGTRQVSINVADGNDEEVRSDSSFLLDYETVYVSMHSNNFRYPSIPSDVWDILDNDFVMVDSYYPYPSHPREYVRKFVRKDVYAAQ